MLIGLYGGTFDPVHKGHLKIAEEAYKQFKLDELWFIPAKIPPHKQSTVVAGENDRLKMLQLAISESDYDFKICTYELEKESVSYSYLTLTEFKKIYPEYRFLFIIGEDSLIDFSKWKHPEIISEAVDFLVVPRFSFKRDSIIRLAETYKTEYGTNIYILNFTPLDISSTDIRNKIKNKSEVSELLEANVYDYILNCKLYSKGE